MFPLKQITLLKRRTSLKKITALKKTPTLEHIIALKKRRLSKKIVALKTWKSLVVPTTSMESKGNEMI